MVACHRTTACTAAGGSSLHRHRHACFGRRRPRRPPAPRQRHRHRDRSRRRTADQGHLRRPGALGARGDARVSSSGSTSPRSSATNPEMRSASSSAATASRPGARPATRPKQNSLWMIVQAQAYIDAHRVERTLRAPDRRPAPRSRTRSAGPWRPASHHCCGRWPRPTAAWSGTSATTRSSWSFSPGRNCPALAGLGTSCPDHFLRTKVRPLVVDLAPTSDVEEYSERFRTLHAAYREDYAAYYRTSRRRQLTGHARRRSGHRARPGHRDVLVRPGQADGPRGGRVLRQRHQRDARGGDHLDLRTHRGEREVPGGVLGSSRRRNCDDGPRPARTRAGSPWSRERRAGSAAPSPVCSAPRGACVVVADLDAEQAIAAAAGLGGPDVAVGVGMDVTAEREVEAATDAALIAFGGLDLLVNCAGLSLSRPSWRRRNGTGTFSTT